MHRSPHRFGLQFVPIGAFGLAATVASIAAAFADAQSANKQTIQSIRVVSALTTVTDAQTRMVPNLTENDFEILVDGKPQPIISVRHDVQPISVIVAIDRSASMINVSPAVSSAVEQFLRQLSPGDEARAVAFSDTIQITSHFTPARDLATALQDDLPFGNGTKLYDALLASLDALKERKARRAVVVITDGEDTASRVSRGTVIDRERMENVIIYAIGLHTEYFNGREMVRNKPGRGLRNFAEESGGEYFEVEKTINLTPALSRIAEELHALYELTFASGPLDGQVHAVSVRAKQQSLAVHSRRSYKISKDASSKPR